MIIALSGYARSGKDTLASFLGSGFIRKSFAAPMKEAMVLLNPYVDSEGTRLSSMVEEHGWDIVKEKYPESRRILQVYGTEIGRKMYGENFWVDQAMKDLSPTENYVFTDARFPNEAQAIKNAGGEVWRVVRSGTEPVNAHVSECSLDQWDFDQIIFNGGDLDYFKDRVLSLLNARGILNG